MRNQGLIAAALAVGVALLVGGLGEARPPEDTNDEVRRLLKELKDELATQRRMRELESQRTRGELQRLEDRLDQIERRLDGMSYASTRRAASFTPEPLRAGTMRLDNRLGVWATVRINGIPYTVPPLTVRVLRDQPQGTFTYDVTAEGFGWAPPRQTALDSRAWTLTIY